MIRFRFVLVLALLACTESPTGPEVETNPDIRAYVVLDAAQALDSDGRFGSFPDVAPNPERADLISGVRASELATAYVKAYGPAFLPFWELERGAQINLGALKVAPRSIPVQTPFGAVPLLGCHPAHVRLFGSFYHLTLDDAGIPQVLMAVSGQLTEYSVDADGNIQDPILTGMDFQHEGIPLNDTRFSPLSPEQAVALVARATGARIRSVPALVRMNHDYSPTIVLWRLSLDQEISVTKGDGVQERTSVLYVGPFRMSRFLTPAANQPESVTVNCIKLNEQLETVGQIPLTVSVLEGAVIEFAPVTLVGS